MSLKSFQEWAREQDKLPRYTRPDLEKKKRQEEEELRRQEEVKKQRESEGLYTKLDRKVGGILPGGISGGPSFRDVASDVVRLPRNMMERATNAASLGLYDKFMNWSDKKISEVDDSPVEPSLYQPKTPIGTGAGVVGEMYGMMAPIGGYFKGANLLTKGLIPTTTAGRLGKAALTGGLAGAGYEGTLSALEGNDAAKIADDAGRGAVFFGAGGLAGDVVSAGVNRYLPRTPNLAKDFIHGATVGGVGLAATIPTLSDNEKPTLGDLGTTAGSLGAFSALMSGLSRGKLIPPALSGAEKEVTSHGTESVLSRNRGIKTEPTPVEETLIPEPPKVKQKEIAKPIPEEDVGELVKLDDTLKLDELTPELQGKGGSKAEDIGLKPEQAGTYDPGTIGAARLTVPGKMQPIGEGQKVRSFNVSTAQSEMASPDVKIANIMEMYPNGLASYSPIKLREVDAEAQKLISQDIEKATRLVLDSNEPSALKTATGIRLIEKYQNANNYERAIDVSLAMAERLTKAGQEISAARIMSALKPDGVLVFAQRQINKINQGKKFGKDLELSPDTAKNLEELAKRMKNAVDENARLEAGQELQGALNALKPSGILRKIDATQTISQLLNPKTIIRNVAGNEMFYRLERLNKIVATPIDWTVSKLTGADRQVTFRTAGQGGYWQGFFKGGKAGWKGVNPDGIQTQYDLGRAPAFNINPERAQNATTLTGKVVGKAMDYAEKTMAYLERTLGVTLKSFDFAAYTRAKNQTLGELATLRAINTTGKADRATVQGLMQDAETNLLDIADQYGKYVTFQDNNVISKGLQGIKDTLNAKQDWGIGSVVLKYPRTPGALVVRGLEYSPAGFLKSAYEIAKVLGSQKGLLKNAKYSQREATLALSRAITGTAGLTGLGYFLADQGIITGSMEKDKDLRELQRQIGEGQYRVNLSALTRWVQAGFNKDAAQPIVGDKIINYDWMQPIAMAISMGANISKNIQEGQSKLENAPSTAANSLEGALNTVAEQPVLQGLTRAVQGYDMGENVTNTLKGIPSSFMPTLGNQIRTYSDNTGRSTYDPSPAKEAVNKAKVKIPGLAGELPVAYDSFGKPKETYQDSGNSLFNVFLNPAFTAKYKMPEEARLAIDTFKNIGETKQIPRVIAKYFIVSGRKIQLTAEEYSEMQRIVGEQTQKGFAKIPQKASDDIKIKKMIDVLSDAGMEGKKYILKQRGIPFKKKGGGIALR